MSGSSFFTSDQVAALTAPLDGKVVRERAQAGRKLSYIEGWWAIAEANRIFGYAAWDRETYELRQLGDPREVDGKWRIAYMARVRITVRVDGGEVVRDGCGYGSGIDRDLGQSHESAVKEAETDAMKRALMTFGNPFGLALYDKEQRNVTDGEPAQSLGNGKSRNDFDTGDSWEEWAKGGIGSKCEAWVKKAKQDIASMVSVEDIDRFVRMETLGAKQLRALHDHNEKWYDRMMTIINAKRDELATQQGRAA
jgi:DNA repair and recombination protein RAD52